MSELAVLPPNHTGTVAQTQPTTTTDVVVPTATGAMRLVEWAQEAQAANHLAKALVRTPFAGSWRGDEDGATAAILKGAEVGLTPVTALGAFDNIQGRPAPQAITLRALVQSHGHDLEIIEETDDRAVARYRRAGRGEWLTTDYTMADAAAAGLATKDQWQKNRRAMLIARVTSKAARLVASDVILGIGYSAEELRDLDPHQRALPTLPDQQPRGLAAALDPGADDRDPGPAAETPITDRTRGQLFALFNQKGVADADQLPGINHITGKAYASRRDLSEADALRVIEVLKGRPDAEPASAPAAEPDQDGAEQ